jgi:hypothetical protein
LWTRKYQVNQWLRTSVVEPVRSIPQRRRFALLLMVCEGKLVFPIYAVKKVFSPTCNTAGVKIFWKQARRRLIGDTTREASSHEVVDLKKSLIWNSQYMGKKEDGSVDCLKISGKGLL